MQVSDVTFKAFCLRELESQDSDVNKKFKESFKDGFFYLEIPQDCRELIKVGTAFANSFYKSEKVKETKLSGFGGYHDREKAQVEAHYAEKADWEALSQQAIYSEELIQLAKKMNEVGIQVLKKVLAVLEIPEDRWDELTGNLSSGGGTCHFTANHYRPEKDLLGIPAHKDYGYITVLFCNTKGLQGLVENEWVDVPPLQDHFIINFGKALELMTQSDGRVTAIAHKVPKMDVDRISFGIFQDGNLDSSLYSYNSKSNTTQKVFDTYREYLAQSFKETY